MNATKSTIVTIRTTPHSAALTWQIPDANDRASMLKIAARHKLCYADLVSLRRTIKRAARAADGYATFDSHEKRCVEVQRVKIIRA